ncbi:hypothetical protein R70006_05056 [Paraburkholderia domus]|uniref:hypothetical protein n=1 Tax=Paraburkholderia domus TaxID=2793075 RepID=UPI0019148B03|nr:hypothetical protein [Paraburkholderia domus]MBK5051707.1 hypothetical protein [Burkholderia sp. R-70006]CAE6795572.1 hypothetical protein R70006_05056 [Paraburkholderia domus]
MLDHRVARDMVRRGVSMFYSDKECDATYLLNLAEEKISRMLAKRSSLREVRRMLEREVSPKLTANGLICNVEGKGNRRYTVWATTGDESVGICLSAYSWNLETGVFSTGHPFITTPHAIARYAQRARKDDVMEFLPVLAQHTYSIFNYCYWFAHAHCKQFAFPYDGGLFVGRIEERALHATTWFEPGSNGRASRWARFAEQFCDTGWPERLVEVFDDEYYDCLTRYLAKNFDNDGIIRRYPFLLEDYVRVPDPDDDVWTGAGQ